MNTCTLAKIERLNNVIPSAYFAPFGHFCEIGPLKTSGHTGSQGHLSKAADLALKIKALYLTFNIA